MNNTTNTEYSTFVDYTEIKRMMRDVKKFQGSVDEFTQEYLTRVNDPDFLKCIQNVHTPLYHFYARIDALYSEPETEDDVINESIKYCERFMEANLNYIKAYLRVFQITKKETTGSYYVADKALDKIIDWRKTYPENTGLTRGDLLHLAQTRAYVKTGYVSYNTINSKQYIKIFVDTLNELSRAYQTFEDVLLTPFPLFTVLDRRWGEVSTHPRVTPEEFAAHFKSTNTTSWQTYAKYIYEAYNLLVVDGQNKSKFTRNENSVLKFIGRVGGVSIVSQYQPAYGNTPASQYQSAQYSPASQYQPASQYSPVSQYQSAQYSPVSQYQSAQYSPVSQYQPTPQQSPTYGNTTARRSPFQPQTVSNGHPQTPTTQSPRANASAKMRIQNENSTYDCTVYRKDKNVRLECKRS